MADLSITAANVAAGEDATVEHGRAGATITAGQTVYRSASTGRYLLADNNNASAEVRGTRGIALNNASNGQPLAVQRGGAITIGATLTAGTDYWQSDTPGGICARGDLASGEYAVLLGVATSASVLRLDIQNSGVAL